MNRELKFRAFDDSKNIMSKPFSFNQVLNFKDKNIRSLLPKEDIVMQFTGLKDKNDINIYEGDIVRWGLGFTDFDYEYRHRYAVVQFDPELQFKILYYINSHSLEKEKGDNFVFGFSNFIYKETNIYLEVIGNIHENPELAK